MSPHVQEQVQHTVDLVTSSPATVTSVGGATAIIIANAPIVIQGLTIAVLSAQLIAWVYKGYRWFKNNNK